MWLQTYTGKQFYPMDPDPSQIDIVDIAHHLSNLCRFTGAVSQFYSVAEHSVRVAWALRKFHRPELEMWGLLHDAPEAYLNDIAMPVKRHPALSEYRQAEDNLMSAVAYRFGLPPEHPAPVKVADQRMLMTEAKFLMGNPPDEWGVDAEPYEDYLFHAFGWEPQHARTVFLNTFQSIMERR